MSQTEVKIIEHSVSALRGTQIITYQLRYWRAIHSELMTHRVFSRNASSSRAIPVSTMLKQVWNDPAMPLHWGQNQPGMQARKELSGFKRWAAIKLWRAAAKVMCVFAYLLNELGLHKQVANRLLEPFQFISVVLTTTELTNWFELRDHPDAQPEIQDLARKMLDAKKVSVPNVVYLGEWHLPYISREERALYPISDLLKMSTARCARVSYLTHDGMMPDRKKDIALYERLVGSKPLHASPTEHQATPVDDHRFHKNFRNWVQFREEVEERILENSNS